ncbi:pilin [Crossiella sp. CA198]|uniref:pilin n=1 Tax=Crossiella sp. CA198 TaxID=3455607 RepID=UPI003F8D62EF
MRRALPVVALLAAGWLGAASSAQAEPAAVLALAKSLEEVLSNIQLWLAGILGGLATLFLSFGGARYVAAGGDPGEVSKAKLALKCAGVGYAVALLAPLIVEILKRIVGAGP